MFFPQFYFFIYVICLDLLGTLMDMNFGSLAHSVEFRATLLLSRQKPLVKKASFTYLFNTEAGGWKGEFILFLREFVPDWFERGSSIQFLHWWQSRYQGIQWNLFKWKLLAEIWAERFTIKIFGFGGSYSPLNS